MTGAWHGSPDRQVVPSQRLEGAFAHGGALLCDVDGVLRIWDRSVADDLEKSHGMPRGTFGSVAFAQDLLRAVTTGFLSDSEWRATVAERLLPWCASEQDARTLVARWGAASTIDQRVLNVLRQVNARIPVVLVTNGTDRVETDLASLGVVSAVTAVVNSARIGVAKPSPEIYHVAVAVAGVPLHRCVFVDDLAENVAAAGALGIPGFLYRTPADLAAAVDRLGRL